MLDVSASPNMHVYEKMGVKCAHCSYFSCGFVVLVNPSAFTQDEPVFSQMVWLTWGLNWKPSSHLEAIGNKL